MRHLLDTHTLLWIINGDPKLSEKVKSLFLDEDNDIAISMASIWEMAIKISLNKLKIPGPLAEFVAEHIKGNKINILPIELNHIYHLENLPFFHRDPFDRLIIAQAMAENMSILGQDEVFDQYSINRIW